MEDMKAMLEGGEIIIDDVEDEQVQDIISFDIDVIAAHEEFSQFDKKEYDLGVKEASKYIGQFHSLINAGLNSETALVVMSWIREEKLNKDNIKASVEIESIRDIKLKHEVL